MSDANDFTVSIEQEINQITVSRPHVVVLGAGASLAALPDGDRNGNKLPLMANLIEVTGISEILKKFKVAAPDLNFEDFYSGLVSNSSTDPDLIYAINEHIYDYFSCLSLPDFPTLYDHLVLSLRKKDVIATFNWDPFLIQAYIRNKDFAELPQFRFLHGNVAVAHCMEHNAIGSPKTNCPKCKKILNKSQILFPIEKKDYNNDAFIKSEWEAVKQYINGAFMFTIFGYSAPKSDIEAISLMKESWVKHKSRELLETEIIDVKSKQVLEETWDEFLFSHHYMTTTDFYSSWISKHPRRSCEAMWNTTMEAKFVSDNHIPKNLDFPELYEWLEPLIKVEKAHSKK